MLPFSRFLKRHKGMRHDVLSVSLSKSPVLVSIITVSRNDADRLSTTIQSLTRYYGDSRYEHLVIDGESSDHTHQVVAPLAGVTNFHFDSALDKGIYDAMNRGMRHSSGKFLLFVNCGDRMLMSPDVLAHCLDALAQESSADIICFPYEHVDYGGSKWVAAGKATPDRLPTSHQGMIFLASFVRTHNYNIRYRIAADYDLYLHADPSRVRIAPTDVPLAAVEVHGIASRNPWASYREYWAIAFANFCGIKRIVCLIRIAGRAALVILIKQVFPSRWVDRWRRMR